jgi:hypothetical protein
MKEKINITSHVKGGLKKKPVIKKYLMGRSDRQIYTLVEKSVDCESEMHVIEENDEESVSKVHVVGNMQKESVEEGFATKDYNEKSKEKEFVYQTQETTKISNLPKRV